MIQDSLFGPSPLSRNSTGPDIVGQLRVGDELIYDPHGYVATETVVISDVQRDEAGANWITLIGSSIPSRGRLSEARIRRMCVRMSSKSGSGGANSGTERNDA